MKRDYLLIVLILISSVCMAQKPSSVSGNFDSTRAEEFFKQVEAQTSYRFYYDVSQIDSLVISLNAKDVALPDLLRQAFAKTDFLFSIDNQNRVFITRKVQVVTALPKDYFKKTADTITTANTININQPVKTAKKINSENKIYEIGTKSGSKPGAIIINGYI